MALDLTCIPTIREEVVRLRRTDLVDGLDVGLLAYEAAGRSAQRASARRHAATTRGPSHRHRPSRLVHAH
jgi:hypothetical protein